MKFTAQLKRWQQSPADFIETQLVDPVTSRPFTLLPAERAFIERAFEIDEKSGRLRFPELIYATPRKGGKTGFAAMMMLTMVLLFGGRFSEGYVIANDLEQAESRVFQALSRIVECSPLLNDAEPTRNKVVFPNFSNATIVAIASDAAGAAGHNACFSTFDELWGFTSERSRRLWDEMSTSPVRKISARLTTTYAGYEGESVLLEELYRRGLAQQKVGKDLYAGDGMLMFWTHEPVAPWQTQAWIDEQRRSLRPNQYLRQIENRFVGAESSFIDMALWDQCVDPAMRPMAVDQELPIYVGIDASVKHDSTAVLGVTWDKETKKVRLVCHRIFQPSPNQPLNFEETIEATVLDLAQRFRVCRVLFDPYQMASTAQRLQGAGIRIEEFPQTTGNLTAASQNLFELINGHNLIAYPDPAMRLAVSRAVAVESPRGWRIAKEKASHKIDIVVALAMAAHAAVTMGAVVRRALAVGVETFGSTGSGGRVYGAEADQAHADVYAKRTPPPADSSYSRWDEERGCWVQWS
jgi:phage terminase large subunit-like protein